MGSQDASEESLRKGGAKAIPESEDKVKVKSMKAAFGYTQNATLALLSNLADKLKKKREKISWVFCLGVERKEEERCWCVGHLTAECKGVDRLRDVSIVDVKGHQNPVYKQKAKCKECWMESHLCGSYQCQMMKSKNATELRDFKIYARKMGRESKEVKRMQVAEIVFF